MKTLTQNNSITSLELAELTGMAHANLLKAMRKMERVWENTTGVKFNVSTYSDASGKKNVMYQLSKTESLYVISKFKDEIRAKVILRWEELENATQKLPAKNEDTILLEAMQILNNRIEQKDQQILLQEKVIKQAAPKVEYFNQVLQSKSTYNTNQIAKEMGMSAITLNKILKDKGVQYKQQGTWLLYNKHQNKGYTKTKTHTYYNSLEEKCTAMQTVWTEKGRLFIHSLFD